MYICLALYKWLVLYTVRFMVIYTTLLVPRYDTCGRPLCQCDEKCLFPLCVYPHMPVVNKQANEYQIFLCACCLFMNAFKVSVEVSAL
jgi:hypothetical protein